ncbi:MAG TPA: hypothetical protein VNZ03_35265 [Terriglobales bacterium]|jgi:hypothetical protein|nr:hypothetical protein [Terriglobales bacterium]
MKTVKPPVLIFTEVVALMAEENPESELTRLLQEQTKARQREVYGGLSHTEKIEYNRRADRISELCNHSQTDTPAVGPE